MIDYRKFYNLERYLLEEVGPRFRDCGVIEPIDLFLIFVWKSNRAKTRVRDKVKKKAGTFADGAAQISAALFAASNPQERLRILMQDWGLRLPMASAVLTVLYPDEFTVYDYRVCNMLGLRCRDSYSKRYWSEYLDYKAKVCEEVSKQTAGLTLRDKDRFLWGKSLWEDAVRDAQ
jgi:hypothetical protein